MDYQIPDGMTSDAVAAALTEHLAILAESVAVSETTYYDTFDWALYAAGGVLRRQGDELRWMALDGSATETQTVTGELALAGDLPPGPVRERIPASAAIRRLLVMMRLTTRTRALRVLDDNQKTVVRLHLSTDRFEDPATARGGELPGRLEILGVRGYDEERARVADLVETRLGLCQTNRQLLTEALAAVGRSPLEYSSKLNIQLDPDERADRAAKHILTTLLETIAVNVRGARENLDSEFLHDLRVATRRTRSALSQIKAVFAQETVAHFKERFAWMQQLTGPVRDLDVYLLAFEGYRRTLPAPMRPGLDPLRAFLLSHYDQEQAKLAHALGSPELLDLLQSWREFLDRPAPERSVVANAMKPIKPVADARIWAMARRVRREQRAIQPDSAPEELHELRKSCKKLRYLMEFFRSLYPDDDIQRLIKTLKGLLDLLGDYQDLAVQADHLQNIARRMHTERAATPETLLAMGALIGGLLQRQQEARAGLAQAFMAFDQPDHWACYQALFRAQQPEEGAA